MVYDDLINDPDFVLSVQPEYIFYKNYEDYKKGATIARGFTFLRGAKHQKRF